MRRNPSSLIAGVLFGYLAACAAVEQPAVTSEPEAVVLRSDGIPPIRSAQRETFDLSEFVVNTSVEQERLEGTGVVYGLGGTGDTLTGDTKSDTAIRAHFKRLAEAGVIPDIIDDTDLENGRVALVKISARFPPERRPGTRFDIILEPLGNAFSLAKGKLWPVRLFDSARANSDENLALTVEDLSGVERVLTPAEELEMKRYNMKFPPYRARAWRLPNGGYLVRELPMGRSSDDVVVLTLSIYNRDIYSSLTQTLKSRYPVEVSERSGGQVGQGRLAIRLPPNFVITTEAFVAELNELEFEVTPAMPIVVFDNRLGEVRVIGGPVRLRRRWMTTAHLPKESNAMPTEQNRGMFTAAGNKDTSAPTIRPLPYIITSPDEDFATVRESLTNANKPSAERAGRHVGGAARLAISCWPDGAQSQERRYLLPRNDIADVLCFMRDYLKFPASELRQFCVEAVRQRAIEAYVHERLPWQVLSGDRTMTYFPESNNLAVGTELLEVSPVSGVEPGTWDLAPRPPAHDFTPQALVKIGEFLPVIEGNTFRWRDAQRKPQYRVIRLSTATVRAVLEYRAIWLTNGRTVTVARQALQEDAANLIPLARFGELVADIYGKKFAHLDMLERGNK